jgi:hypothetical protein
MLSELIEKVSGKSLNEFADQNIFTPLGMRNSHFHDNYLHLIPNRAFSYSPNGDTFDNLIMRFDQVGSGGLYSSVEDLYLWDQNFYHNKLGKGEQELINKMYEEGKLNSGESAGYAFALVNGNYRGLRTVSHTGALAGYRAVLTRFPDQKFSVIILSNISTFNSSRTAEKVADLYLFDQMEPADEDQKKQIQDEAIEDKKNEVHVMPDNYTGRFYSDELEVYYELDAVSDSLMLKVGDNMPSFLKPKDEDHFSGVNGNLQITFSRDNKGVISGFVLDAGRVTNLKFKKL